MNDFPERGRGRRHSGRGFSTLSRSTGRATPNLIQHSPAPAQGPTTVKRFHATCEDGSEGENDQTHPEASTDSSRFEASSGDDEGVWWRGKLFIVNEAPPKGPPPPLRSILKNGKSAVSQPPIHQEQGFEREGFATQKCRQTYQHGPITSREHGKRHYGGERRGWPREALKERSVEHKIQLTDNCHCRLCRRDGREEIVTPETPSKKSRYRRSDDGGRSLRRRREEHSMGRREQRDHSQSSRYSSRGVAFTEGTPYWGGGRLVGDEERERWRGERQGRQRMRKKRGGPSRRDEEIEAWG